MADAGDLYILRYPPCRWCIEPVELLDGQWRHRDRSIQNHHADLAPGYEQRKST